MCDTLEEGSDICDSTDRGEGKDLSKITIINLTYFMDSPKAVL